MDINDEEEQFERFVYPMHSVDSSEEMKLKRSKDMVLLNAKRQLAGKNIITEGPLKNQSSLRVARDLLYRGHQLSVPESMRGTMLLRRTRGATHVFTARSGKLIRGITGLHVERCQESV